MALTVQPVPMFSDNYAWLIRNSVTGEAAIVDPADAEAAMAAVTTAGVKLTSILLTHHHQDHIAGADAMRAATGARIAGAAADAHRLPALDVALVEGDTVHVAAASAHVLETPGHTRGHISFYFAEDALLFCGDTLFSLGCGRLLEGSAEEMFASLGKIAHLPAETQVFCGHEYTESNARFAATVEPSNAALWMRALEVTRLRQEDKPSLPCVLADELAANPFLRAGSAERLAALRSAKDNFRG